MTLSTKEYTGVIPNANETVESKLNNFLILDVPLQAFIPLENIRSNI